MLGYVLGVTLVLTALSFGFFTESFANSDSFNVTFDKKQYYTGDLLTISGKILDLGMPVIAMSVYDPSGKILSANNLEISSENTFSKSISLVSPFYEKTGEYTVKLDYGQISENHYFAIISDKPDPNIPEKPDKEPKIISLSTEKKQYTDKDIIKINGLVSSLGSPTVLIGVHDPFGMPVGFYFGPVNSDLEFSTSFLIKSGVNFKVDGTYSIKAHYAETETVSIFDYYKEVIPPVTEDPPNIPEEKTNDDNDIDNPSDENNSGKTDDSDKEEVTPDSSTSSPSSDEKLTPKEEISNDDSTDSTSITEEYEHEPESKSDSAIQNNVETTKDEKDNSEKTSQKIEPKKHSNLSVEDIELGKLLNQINLECDQSILTDTISYYDGMGPALYRLCNFDDSLNFFNDSLIENPNDVKVLVNKGSTLGKLGFFSEALVYYDQAIDIDPDFLPAKNNKANVLVNIGYVSDAILLYHEILDENPDYVTARKNLEIVLSQTLPNETLVEIDSSSSLNTINVESHVFEEELVESPDKINTTNNTKQKPANFFEEVGSAFSSLGSLFDFLN